ncbi:hypothetical protein DICPUDRAFT_154622 [Dictyostelium purpureum]|uniref:Uncharacterized protein n=1 Tax=Dictyostelium purpureum TaxID=5786 RepID=F0ZRT8_DICPU|nr:uncharacterized protein DICPUDRAFT_154622 [Dictyostelium purpureum]EGC33344.1 hypothetical protein DICPUDRAFT_154622 [Dictyostelium purpureum]|eukprot:XP_003290129.1 hypothetical protein DICPUDRAFT_154622 [Dictyostelium purpureum]
MKLYYFILLLIVISIASFSNGQILCSSQSDCDNPKTYCVTLGIFPIATCLHASRVNHICSHTINENGIYIGSSPCDQESECKIDDILGFHLCKKLTSSK